jgi:hypothetical protein
LAVEVSVLRRAPSLVVGAVEGVASRRVSERVAGVTSRTVVVRVVRVVGFALWVAQPVNSKPASRAVVNPEQVANERAGMIIGVSPWAIEGGG